MLLVGFCEQGAGFIHSLLHRSTDIEFAVSACESPEAPQSSNAAIAILLEGQGLGRDLDLLSRASQSRAILVVSEVPSVAGAVTALKEGGSDYLVSSELTPHRLEEAILAAQRRARQRRMLEDMAAKLEEMARHDPLTGALSRGAFMELLLAEILRVQRYRTPLSLIFVDLDHFKTINDTHGHPVGDRALVETHACFESILRSTDRIGRIGGDEFAILAPHTTPVEARCLAERLHEGVGALSCALPGGETLSLSCSMGVTGTAGAPVEMDDLLLDADRCLYVAKRAGRNRVAMCGSTASGPASTGDGGPG